MGIFWHNSVCDCYSIISVNTGLGLSFLRIVNEEGSNGWAQVYARIPFDDSELQNKGALFGVIYGEEKEGWAEKDMELMGWVEDYFNKVENGGVLLDFFEKWRSGYPNLSGVWVWVQEREGNREVMLVRTGGAEIFLLRGEKEFDFSASMLEGKVAKGKVEEDDRIAIWTEGVLEIVGKKSLSEMGEGETTYFNETIKNRNFAGAGLVLNFRKFEDETAEITSIEVEPIKLTINEPEEVIPRRAEDRQGQELVNERYVGPIGIKEKLSNWWMKTVSRVRRPIHQKDVAVVKETSKRKKWAVLLGLLFLLVLLISLVTGSLKIRREAEQKKWVEYSEPIEKSLQEAAGLVSLNPSGARKLVQDAKTIFEAKRGDFEGGKYSDALDELEKKIENTWTLVSGEKESQIEEVARIDLVRQGFKGDRLSLIKDRHLVAFDGTMGVVMTVELSTKDIKVIAGKGEGLGWIDAVGDNSRMVVLNSSGVRNAINGQDLIKFDAAVAKPVAMGRFGNNLYILDQGNKEIFKYAAIGDGYGERSRWLKQDQNMSILPVDMAIDSDIWVVSAEGEVEKYRRGSKENFSISGLTSGVKISRMAVEPEGDRIALLDNNSGVVAVCSKTSGSCTQLLKSEKLREAKDVEFDEKGNLLVLLPGVVGILK